MDKELDAVMAAPIAGNPKVEAAFKAHMDQLQPGLWDAYQAATDKADRDRLYDRLVDALIGRTAPCS